MKGVQILEAGQLLQARVGHLCVVQVEPAKILERRQFLQSRVGHRRVIQTSTRTSATDFGRRSPVSFACLSLCSRPASRSARRLVSVSMLLSRYSVRRLVQWFSSFSPAAVIFGLFTLS